MEQSQGVDSNSDGGSIRNDGIVVTGASSRFETLPEDCISKVISHTSPRDACIVASVSKSIKSAAQSDLVWETFIPPEYSSLVPRLMNHSSKKEIYLSLADDSVLIDDGKKSFWLEKSSGKKCYMLSAMDLTIVWADNPSYWQWISVPESKFEKVAEVRNVCWFEIHGKISCRMLSKGTHYSVYVVFKRAGRISHGFDYAPVKAEIGFVGSSEAITKTSVFLDTPRGYAPVKIVCRAFRPRRSRRRFPIEEAETESETESETERETGNDAAMEPKERGDGWSEVELGKFFINNGGSGDGDGDEIEISIMETEKGYWKSCLIIQGIEIRPVKEESRSGV